MVNSAARAQHARRQLSMALAKQSQKQPVPDANSRQASFITGTWVQAESVDGNLSQVTILGQLFRYIPVCPLPVSSMTLSAGCTVLLARVGASYIMLGRVYGNTSLAPQTAVAPNIA